MRRRRESGFIITLELILLLTIMGVVFIFALALIQKHLIESISEPFGRSILVFDSTGPKGNSRAIGRATSFNVYEAPQIVYRIPDKTEPIAALLAVRPSNFTTRQSVYYTNAGCTGSTYMLNPLSPISPTVGEISDLYALQGTAFAIGVDPANAAKTNVLFRSQPGVAPIATPLSRWISERYVANCQPVAPDPILTAALIPAAIVVDMNTLYTPPYWVPDTPAGAPLVVPAVPPGEGGKWP